MNYNYSNFANLQQYTSYAKNLPSKLYNSNPQDKMIQKNIINNNNSKNHVVNDIETYNNNCTPLSVKKKKKGSKKKVKFNDKVCVIKVESYKEFNKIDDNPYLDKLYKELYKENINKFNTIYNNNAQNKSNAKKTKNCECHIM